MDTETAAAADASSLPRAAVRLVGWSAIASGVLTLLYVVYLLFFTSLQTSQAQSTLRDEWSSRVGLPATPSSELDSPSEEDSAESTEPWDPSEPIMTGDAYAALWFTRPDDTPIIADDPLFVVEGVSLPTLRSGPGHYPDSVAPGQPGNFAVAGHRTTYGSPFAALGELQPGDRVYVQDRLGDVFEYQVDETRIVRPTDTWVVGDRGDQDEAILTLTTCHPRYSAAQRLVVFATLVDESASDADA